MTYYESIEEVHNTFPVVRYSKWVLTQSVLKFLIQVLELSQ